jgi:glutathione S-transferase
MLKIHNFARGGRGLRVAWLCDEMGLDYEVVNHPFPVPDSYLALNPLGTVPYLEDDGGVGLNESIAILLYVAQRYGPTPLYPTDFSPMARCLQLTLFGETELGMMLNPLIAARFMAAPADQRNWSVQGLERRVGRSVDHIDSAVRGRPFLVGHDLTLADISVSCGLGIWTGALGGKLPEGLAAYQGRLRSRPAYERARSRCEEKERTPVNPREQTPD